ncbi:MAG TPA: response regulator [Pseudosphingobacterium sp.]|nr:response regulator [Pseudosphingobacterium sp.]
MNLKCYVVDDEQHNVITIIEHIEKTDGLELIGSSTNPVVALEEIKKEKPDVVFTDLNMDVMNGITLAGHIDDFAQIVIVSGNPQHYYKNVDWKNYIYVLKGMSDKEFGQIISDIKSHMANK